MPGRRSPPVEESVLKRCSSAFTSVPRLRASSFCARSGVHHHAGRLVHHRQVGVFIDHIQRNVFRRGLQRRGMRLAGNGDPLAAAQLQRSLLALAVDQHIALLDEQLHARAAHAFELRGKKLIEPLAARLRGHFDRAQCSSSRFAWPPHALRATLRSRSTSAAGNHQQNGGNLRPVERAAEQRAAALGIAPEFGDEDGNPDAHQPQPGHIALRRSRRQPDQQQDRRA